MRTLLPLFVVLFTVACGAASESTSPLELSLTTDFQPFKDFVGVDVTIEDETNSYRPNLETNYAISKPTIATFRTLSHARAVTVTAHLVARDGSIIQTITRTFEHEGPQRRSLVFQRACEDVACGSTDYCSNGACVDRVCLNDPTAEGCPVFCSDDLSVCAPSNGCGTTQCIDNRCVIDAEDNTCGASEYCDLDIGCLELDTECNGPDDCENESSCRVASCVATECDDASCVTNLCILDNVIDDTPCENGGSCQSGVCEPPPATCNDQIKNQNEAGVDCGGECGPTCPNNTPCDGPNQCVGVCDTVFDNVCENISACSNGHIEGLEGCDDGNTNPGDGCTPTCQLEEGTSCISTSQCEFGTVCDLLESNTCEPANTCGNGTTETGEFCDDGDLVNGDGCSDTCFVDNRNDGATCGQDLECASGICDISTCEPANTCGNSRQEGAEACDDGALLNGDGCNDQCLKELTQLCATNAECASTICDQMDSNQCEPANTCGNGTREGTEECDDGDLTNRDGCSETCKTELPPGSACMNGFDCQSGACLAGFCTNDQYTFIKPSNTGAQDEFGYGGFALSGDTLVVGAFFEDSCADGVNGDGNDNNCDRAGAAYVFRNNGGTWIQEAYLKASNSDALDFFGYVGSVGVDGDTIVVGAREEDSCATTVGGAEMDNTCGGQGAAYVFVRNGAGQWTQEAYLKATNGESGDAFGTSADVSGDRVVVGAWSEASCIVGDANNNICDSGAGAAYVFDRSGTTWSQTAYLKASNVEDGDLFGETVEIDGDTAVVGTRDEDSCADGVNGDGSNNGCEFSGAAYVFHTANGTTWTEQAYIKATNSEENRLFGFRFSLNDDTLAVGGYDDSCATGMNGNQLDMNCPDAGAVYIYKRTGTSWAFETYLKPDVTTSSLRFGNELSLSDDNLIVSATKPSQSQAYLFVRDGTSWTQEYLERPVRAHANDLYGYTVAVSDSVIAVSGRRESSCATGFSGDETNNGCGRSGAVYAWTTSP